jgi:formate dehydrogenase subunit delta
VTHNKLTAMANQIAIFFKSYPHDRAVEGVAKHIERFWSPHMRNGLRAEIAANPEGADALVLEAIARDRQPLEHAA